MTIKENNNLLPCPFCGGVAKIRAWDEHGDYLHKVFCTRCYAESNNYLGEVDALEAWNERVEG